MDIQKTDWGEIRWYDQQAKVMANRRLQVGKVYVYPGAHQYKHIHYDEQVLYCISGEALSCIDGEYVTMKPGCYFHYRSGIEHEVWATSKEPFVHLLISNPMAVETDPIFHKENKIEADPQLLYEAIESIQSQILDNLNYGYAIFDNLGNLVVQSKNFPRYCVENCNPGDRQGLCRCMRQLAPALWNVQTSFVCPYGMEILHNPIIFGDSFLGYIQGGYFRYSSRTGTGPAAAYDVPESVITGVGALLRRIVRAIQNYCEFKQIQTELQQKDLQIASESEKKDILMQDLRKTQYEVTELKINNHFLFNTLNQMASLAVESGQMELYGSIVNLSKLFHYTLRMQRQMVPLSKELEYIDAYLSLQKLRYQNRLIVEKEIDPAVLEQEVPFNFIQPIVENAFLHGFPQEMEKRILLRAEKKAKDLVICVINSGTKLSEAECAAINAGILANTSRGLSMVFQKIQAASAGKSKLEACITEAGDTCFCITLHCEDKV